MRDLLSGALPAPEDEPRQRELIDDAIRWGVRRRRRDVALTGAAALAVIAVAAGGVAVGTGSGTGGSSVVAAGSPGPTSTQGSAGVAPSPLPSRSDGSKCVAPPGISGSAEHYCQLLDEMRNYAVDFAKGSVPYIQADLPQGYSVTAPGTTFLVLTGPNGKTNYLFPSTEPFSAPAQEVPLCDPTVSPGCAGGIVVVTRPSGAPSSGSGKSGGQDPRIDLSVGTSGLGSLSRVAAPTSATSLLTNEQLLKIADDAKYLAYAEQQVQHRSDISKQLVAMEPPSATGSAPSYRPPTATGSAASSASSPSYSPPTAIGTASSSPSYPPSSRPYSPPPATGSSAWSPSYASPTGSSSSSSR